MPVFTGAVVGAGASVGALDVVGAGVVGTVGAREENGVGDTVGQKSSSTTMLVRRDRSGSLP